MVVDARHPSGLVPNLASDGQDGIGLTAPVARVAAMGAASFEVFDTPSEVEARVVERWRVMSARERFEQVAVLNQSCMQMAEAGVRLRYPSATLDEVRLRVIALRLGRDLMVGAYGWDPAVEGW